MTLTEYLNQDEPKKLNYGEVIIEPNDERVKIYKIDDFYFRVCLKLGNLGLHEYFVEIKKDDKLYEKGLLKFYYFGTDNIGKSCFRLNMDGL